MIVLVIFNPWYAEDVHIRQTQLFFIVSHIPADKGLIVIIFKSTTIKVVTINKLSINTTSIVFQRLDGPNTKRAGARARNWRKTFVRGNEMGLIKIGTKPPVQGCTWTGIVIVLTERWIIITLGLSLLLLYHPHASNGFNEPKTNNKQAKQAISNYCSITLSLSDIIDNVYVLCTVCMYGCIFTQTHTYKLLAGFQ